MTSGWQLSSGQDTTPRPNASQLPVPTPGLAIVSATPGPTGNLPSAAGSWERGSLGEREDYFAADRTARAPATPATDTSEMRVSHENGAEKVKDKDKDKGADNVKSPGTPFGRKFRMSFSSKKLRSLSQATQDKPVVAKDGTEESESSSTHEKEIDDSFLGVLQKIHQDYDKQLVESPERPLETQITPSLPSEAPVLKLPPGTRVILQEETSGGSANIWQGTIEDIGRDVDIIERKAPMWLGEVLLRNFVPPKEPIKVSFILHPLGNLPPISPGEGCNRLNANRLLRVKKILAYVAERIEQLPGDEPDGLMPEDYLELYCNDQVSRARPLSLKGRLTRPLFSCWVIPQAWPRSEPTSGKAVTTSSCTTKPRAAGTSSTARGHPRPCCWLTTPSRLRRRPQPHRPVRLPRRPEGWPTMSYFSSRNRLGRLSRKFPMFSVCARASCPSRFTYGPQRYACIHRLEELISSLARLSHTRGGVAGWAMTRPGLSPARRRRLYRRRSKLHAAL